MTAAVALVSLNVSVPMQAGVYDLFYLQVGPSEATETAILTHFLVSSVVAISVPLLVGDYLSDRGANLRTLGWGVAALLGLVLVFVVVALAGLAAFLTALVILAIGLVGIPLTLRYQAGVRSGGLAAFVGGIPVIILLLFLAGFGIGWGWGYIMIAEEVSESSVDGPIADFDSVPQVRDDVFAAGDCSTDTANRRECLLYLRGYEHETQAARFMARHGVRCPYQNSPTGGMDAFYAEYEGSYYRVRCSPHGD
ncbi:hypothetical protein ACKVMT_03120 [Halobacteriales archaeon Cl-PHB]